jgi:cystathionine gamma-synthase
MRDLLQDPAWQESDIGVPIPDSPHACSVCLPTWDSIIGYEEGREKITHRMQMGYPRFFRHPLVERLTAQARAELAGDDEDVFLFRKKLAAQRAQRWVEKRTKMAVRQISYQGLHALIVPTKIRQEAKDYQRFTGELVSSRLADDCLNGAMRRGTKAHLLQRRLGTIMGSDPEFVRVFNSGMSAITSVFRSLPGVREGKKTLQIEFPYVDCLKVQELFGNGVVFLNQAEGESFDEALQRIISGEFAAVFTEVPSNPLLRTVNIPRLAEACQKGGVPLVIDDSVASCANVQLFPYADVVTGSLTKWLSGAGDVMAGFAVVREDSPHAGSLMALLSDEAEKCSPLYVADVEVLLSNLKGFPARMVQPNANGLALAEMLAAHPAVDQVWHPSLITTANYEKIKAPKGSYGPLLSFTLKNAKKTGKFYDALALSKGPSFGTAFTLVCPYTMLAHYTELDWAEGCGVPSHLIRVSCGQEETAALLATFEAALAQA